MNCAPTRWLSKTNICRHLCAILSPIWRPSDLTNPYSTSLNWARKLSHRLNPKGDNFKTVCCAIGIIEQKVTCPVIDWFWLSGEVKKHSVKLWRSVCRLPFSLWLGLSVIDALKKRRGYQIMKFVVFKNCPNIFVIVWEGEFAQPELASK